MTLNDGVIIFFLLSGSIISLIAAIGLVRLPDVFTRMHASTKAGTLGLGFIMVALAISAPLPEVIFKAVATIVFIIITAPVAAHLLGRAAYRLGEDIASHTVRDDWQDTLRKQVLGEDEPSITEQSSAAQLHKES